MTISHNTSLTVKKISKKTIFYTVILIMVVYSLFPFYWMSVSAFKTPHEIFQRDPTYFPHKFTLENFVNLISKTNALLWLKNSLFVTIFAVGLSVSIASMGAYALTRFKMYGRKTTANLILLIYMFPPIMVGIPLFFIMQQLRLLDSHFGLLLTYVAQVLPYTIWLLRAFFSTIPYDIEEAAIIDGASRFQTIRKIVFPLALPGIVSTSVFAAMVCWNEYVYAFLFLSTETKKTIPIGLRSFLTSHGVLWEYIFALSLIQAIPLAVFFLVFQKRLIATMSGGVKG